MSGPLDPEAVFLRLTVSPPFMPGDGPYLVIRWDEPQGDQVRFYRMRSATMFEAIAEWFASITLAGLVTGPSGIRRVLAALERSGSTIPR